VCGIVGVVGPHSKMRCSEALESLTHRGPDGEGEYFSPDRSVWLGHRRLAIIDPEGGMQPLSNEDGRVWIIFNGCIYNYLELAQRLRQKGHRFRTYCDTEVIVHAYEEYGEECVQHFIGMFAFALWDERSRTLFCARDRIGIKPFYFFSAPSIFAFASEIKALLAMGLVASEVCPDALHEYLVFQSTLGEKTLFQRVLRLLPGHTLTVDARGEIISKRQYWDLRFETDFDHTEEYFVDHLRMKLRDAVRIRLRSDVPLGAHLSGGVDSSTVVCLATNMNGSTDYLKSFSGGFREGNAFDETPFARLVASQNRCEHYEIWPTALDFRDQLARIIFFMDEPAAGPGVFPQFMVSKLAAEHVKVVLGGQGGDEIFAGYARYLIGYLEECLKGAIEETESSARYAATLSSIIPSLSMLQQYVPMLQYFWAEGLFESQESRYFRLMDRSEGIRGIYQPDMFGYDSVIQERFKEIFHKSDAASFLNRMLYFDLKVHLPALLHVEDRTSMAWALESRVPLLDHRIVEFMASIPPVIKFKHGQPKYLFRQAIKNIIPPQVLQRKDKMGFPVPLHLWLKDSLRSFVKEVLLDPRAKQRGIFNMQQLERAIDQEKSFGRVIWGALCIELWFKTFIDNFSCVG
jgi:asparagine synthase (glutamine-hydrolysing)